MPWAGKTRNMYRFATHNYSSNVAKQVARFTVSLIIIIIIIIIIQELIFKKNNHNTCRNLNTCKTIRSKKKKNKREHSKAG